MGFQFQCPQGHVLEGEPEQAGMQCACPICSVMFIIPAPLAAPPDPTPTPAETPAEPGASLPFTPEGSETVSVLHIPCPKGHELEVPRDMLNQYVECPHCQEQFHLREKDSVEYKKKRQAEQERRWERTGHAWMQWSIIIAVIVVLGLVTLIALSP